MNVGLGNGVDATGLVVTLIFVLLDALAIVIMTERRVVHFYDQVASIPAYVWATLGLWVGGSVMTIIFDAVALMVPASRTSSNAPFSNIASTR